MDKIVDVELALSKISNLKFILIKVYNEFLVNNKNLIENLKKYLETDLVEARRCIHSIKGISINLGCNKMYDVTKEFETIILNDEDFNEIFETFKDTFNQMYSEIDLYLKENN